MHEASIAQSIIETIEGRIAAGDITGRVRAITLTIGRLTTVVPDNLCFLFQVLAEDTVLNGVKLEIDHVPIRVVCRACRARYEIKDVDFRCPRCNSPDLDIVSGRELMIESVEVE
jgi:hydrogenase nickel incorporation protein HypA/HybF